MSHDPAKVLQTTPQPAVSLDEWHTMPEPPSLMADTNVMKLIPALWKLDHPK